MVIPVNIQGYFLAQTAGAMGFYLIFDLLATIIWVLVFRIRFIFTTNISIVVIAGCMVILGLIFMVQLSYFLGILTFKFQDIGLFLMIKGNIVAFITGSMIPLVLLPDSIIAAMRVFPFYYVTYLPSMLLIGQNSEEAITGLMVLSVWVMLFTVANKFMYNRLRVRFDGVGI